MQNKFKESNVRGSRLNVLSFGVALLVSCRFNSTNCEFIVNNGQWWDLKTLAAVYKLRLLEW